MRTATPGQPGCSASGSSASGAIQTFTATYYDAGGPSDILETDLLFNTKTSSGPSACQVSWSSLGFYLVSDSGYSLLGPLPGGSSRTLQNSQCILQPASVTAVLNGNTLTLNLTLTFKSGFAGARNVYAEVMNATHDSGWSLMGTWNP